MTSVVGGRPLDDLGAVCMGGGTISRTILLLEMSPPTCVTTNPRCVNIWRTVCQVSPSRHFPDNPSLKLSDSAKSLSIVRLSCFAIVSCQSHGMIWSSVTCAGNGFTSNARILRHFQMKMNGFVEHVDRQAQSDRNIHKQLTFINDPELRTDFYLFWSYKRHITYIHQFLVCLFILL